MWDLWWNRRHWERISAGFSCQSFIPPIAPQSASIVEGWYNRSISGIINSGLGFPAEKSKYSKNCACDIILMSMRVSSSQILVRQRIGKHISTSMLGNGSVIKFQKQGMKTHLELLIMASSNLRYPTEMKSRRLVIANFVLKVTLLAFFL
jgi:hypothetical protein